MDGCLDKDIGILKGVGEKRKALLHKLGIFTLSDLLRYYPRTYKDHTEISEIINAAEKEYCCIVAKIITPVSAVRTRRKLLMFRFKAEDHTGSAEFFIFNQKHLAASLFAGETYLFCGRMIKKGAKYQMSAPEIYPAPEKGGGGILPVYTLCQGLTSKTISILAESALALLDDNPLSDPLPPCLRSKHTLCGLHFALSNIHKPRSAESLKTAQKRLAFEELFILSLGLMRLRKRNRGKTGTLMPEKTDMTDFFAALPYRLTDAQQNAVKEIITDMQKPRPMNRLVQGDVGCGKTIVAAAAVYFAVKNGWQAVIAAPTEILAYQHYKSLAPLFLLFGMKTILLTGSLSDKEKKMLYNDISDSRADICIGTHALFQEKVTIPRLGLVVTDEQHRFGVGQRAAMIDKGDNPHVLVMSATPIPRTLALMLYGDLDVTVIDQKPPGRLKVDTFMADEDMRKRVYDFLRKELEKGHRAYIICPFVEENDEYDKNIKAVEMHGQDIKTQFKDYNPAVLHGQMQSLEKDKVIQSFYSGNSKLLISTTVIEVGVNVPDATVMIIENAERFGLSQLHQLRGRVGRSMYKSYCILMCGSNSPLSRKRLSVLCETNDGFAISEQDLALRGPGDFFGLRQSGRLNRRIAALITDIETLRDASAEAAELLKADPCLSESKHKALKEMTENLLLSGEPTVFN